MKKIIVVLIIWALLWFVILNYKPFLAYYYNHLWNKFYSNKEYFPSIALHSKADLLLDRDEFHYNIWNDYFQIWEKQTSTGAQLAYYQIAENTYSKLLEMADLDPDFHKKVKENYDIVQKKIEELTKKKEEKEEEEDKKEEKWDEEDKSAQNKDDEKEGDEKEQESKNNEGKEKEDENEKKSSDERNSNNDSWDDESEWDTWEEREIDKNNSGNKNGSNSSWSDQLLPAEKKQINKYIENLKAQGEQNMQFFNKKSSSNGSVQDTFFNSFSNNSFFDDMFDRWWEKDW
jgi:hypothetical protein